MKQSGLLPDARHVILPEGIRSTGFPAVEAVCRLLGLEFDGWQQDLNKCLLAKNELGLYAADTCVLSIPRQVGKTWDVGAVAFALCVISPGLTVVWTAHRFKVSRESFTAMRGWAQSQKLTPHIDFSEITSGAGNEVIPFRNGSRIVFAARERGAIRGFTKVGMLVLDEAQILTEAALSDLVPTTHHAPNPLIVLMGTPPKPSDPGDVFTRLRNEAITGDSTDVLYVELSADQDADPDDRTQWARANPSYPHRTSERAILRDRKLLSVDDFLREALGVWDDDVTHLFGAGAWLGCVGTRPRGLKVGALAVAASYDLTSASIAAAAVSDGVAYPLPLQHGDGTTWLVDRARQEQEKHQVDVVIDGRGPAAQLIDDLENAGVMLRITETVDVLDSCADMFDRVRNRKLRHGSWPELDAAVRVAVKRPVGDRWAYGRRGSSADISMLEAVTLASWAADKASMPAIY